MATVKLKTKSFLTACKVKGINPTLPDVSMLDEEYRQIAIDNHKKQVIADAINLETGFVIDWNNTNQYKYQPRFYMGAAGWVYYYYLHWDTYSSVGSRLVFSNSENCEHYAKIILKEKLTI